MLRGRWRGIRKDRKGRSHRRLDEKLLYAEGPGRDNRAAGGKFVLML